MPHSDRSLSAPLRGPKQLYAQSAEEKLSVLLSLHSAMASRKDVTGRLSWLAYQILIGEPDHIEEAWVELQGVAGAGLLRRLAAGMEEA